MERMNMESAVIRMGDIGIIIDMVDDNLSAGKTDTAERGICILKELFEARYLLLRRSLYGGGTDAC